MPGPELQSMMDCPTLIGKNATLVAALVTSVAFSANAMSADTDTDGDSMASFAELQLVYPFLTA